MKPKFVKAHMDAAEVYAQLSSAERLKVGCVVVKNDKIISIGYNGMPAGWTNVCEEETDEGLVTKKEVLHAEANAITKIAKSTESAEDGVLFCTASPCIDCAKLIYQAGIKTVYYRDHYKSKDGINFLLKSGVQVSKL